MKTPVIYAVDDEENIRKLLQYNLQSNGFDVSVFPNGRDMLERCEVKKPDLFLLDLMLPGISGMEICRLIRSDKSMKSIPVIMLTAKSEEIDKVLGLELGADDYVTKPFSVRELMARIRSVLRRSADDDEAGENSFEINGLLIDMTRHEVTKDGILLEMTPKEFELLKILAKNSGKTLTRDYLLEKVWGYEFVGETRTIDVHVRNLRQKIGEEKIDTVRGYGYKFHPEKEDRRTTQ